MCLMTLENVLINRKHVVMDSFWSSAARSETVKKREFPSIIFKVLINHKHVVMDFFWSSVARSETVVVSLWTQDNTSSILHCIILALFVLASVSLI